MLEIPKILPGCRESGFGASIREVSMGTGSSHARSCELGQSQAKSGEPNGIENSSDPPHSPEFRRRCPAFTKVPVKVP